MTTELVDDGTNNVFTPAAAPAAPTRAPHWFWNTVAYLPAVAGAPALTFGVAGLVGRGPRVFRENWVLSGLATVCGAAILAKWQLDRIFLEEPEYELEDQLNGFEIRRYAPRIVAETIVTGITNFDAAREEGFRRLAGYIFGANSQRDEVAITKPGGTRRKADTGERIPMTTPVTSRSSAFGYVVTFTMPRKRLLSDLPVPSDERVLLRRCRAERVAVLPFRGSYDSERVEEKEAELLFRVRAAGLTPRGEPYFAGYDAPSTAAFLRHNEVWIPVTE